MDKLEEIRGKLKKRYLICIFMGVALVFATIATLITAHTQIIYIAVLLLSLIGIVIALISTSKLNRQHRKLFKDTFVLSSLNDIFTNLVYKPELGIPWSVIASTNMMRMGDRYHSEDFMSGEYKGIKFAQADVHIEEEHESTDSEGHTTTTYVTIFRGRWMIFNFNKTFKADVQISQKGFGNSKVNNFLVKKEERFKKVAMESETFNKNFKVYAQNELDAFYIITPSLMERIERLAQNNKGKFLFCFIDNKLHVGLYNGKNSFEPTSVFKKLDIEKIKENISSDIRLITQFVDELNLDNDLFKKEV